MCTEVTKLYTVRRLNFAEEAIIRLSMIYVRELNSTTGINTCMNNKQKGLK